MRARTKNGLLLAGAVLGAAGMIACGGGTGSGDKANPTFAPTLGADKDLATASPKPKGVPAITDGTWVVGEDVPAGTYKVNQEVDSNCYWSISKTGGDLIDNDFPGGGRPKVTLKKGQDFHTDNCGYWTKVG